jgi:hypothetical protein
VFPNKKRAMASEADWDGIEEYVRDWVETRKPKHHWATWTTLVKKKPPEHWQKVVREDKEYQKILKSRNVGNSSTSDQPDAESVEPEEQLPQPEVSEKKRRKRPQSTRDQHREMTKKTSARLTQKSNAQSPLVEAARASAVSRNALHGSGAARAAGEAAASQAVASEQLERYGVGSLRSVYQKSGMNEYQQEVFTEAMKAAGFNNFHPNPHGVKTNMNLEELANEIRDSNNKTRVVFAPIEAAEAAPTYRSLSSLRLLNTDSLAEGSSNSDRMALVRDCCS